MSGVENGFLSREAILGADDLTYEIVEVPEWGGRVRVRSLTGSERDGLEVSIVQQVGAVRRQNLANLRAKLVQRSVVDAAGAPIFTEADVEALGRKSAAALGRVFTVASRLSQLTDEDVESLVGD